jgi:membrane protein implicated in regulation of membrane protease activity
MKTLFFAFVVVITLSVLQAIAADAVTNVPSGGTLEITEAPVNVLLDVYTHVSGLELVAASNISQMGSKVVVLPDSHGGGNLLREIEKALLDQRGILITRLDDKRASVTYNDALKVTPIKDKLTLPILTLPIQSSSRHLTEAQAITLAKPVLPLPAGESYRVGFKDGVWEVWTDRDGSQFRGWTIVRIRDADGKILGTEIRA